MRPLSSWYCGVPRIGCRRERRSCTSDPGLHLMSPYCSTEQTGKTALAAGAVSAVLPTRCPASSRANAVKRRGQLVVIVERERPALVHRAAAPAGSRSGTDAAIVHADGALDVSWPISACRSTRLITAVDRAFRIAAAASRPSGSALRTVASSWLATTTRLVTGLEAHRAPCHPRADVEHV